MKNNLYLVVLFLSMAGAAMAQNTQPLYGHVPAVVSQLAPVGHLDNTNRLNLAISLPLRDQAKLNQLLQQTYDPTSPFYHQYLTPAQFADRFGPSQADYQTLIDFANANGLTVTATHLNRTLLEVSAPVSTIEQVFHTTVRRYQHPNEARTFYSIDAEPTINLTLPILAINGLDNYYRPHSNLRVKPQGKAVAMASPRGGSSQDGGYTGKDFRAAYVPGTTLDGAGQSVGLLQFDGYYTNDIALYIAATGLPAVPLTNVLIGGFNGVPTTGPFSGNGEVALDIEMAMSMAPGLSSIIVYESSRDSTWIPMLNRMATDNLARQLSCSWGNAVPNPLAEVSAEPIFQQMALQGQSFFNASGDSDAFYAPIGFPADSPNITQVGATTLSTASPGGPWSGETVWNWGNSFGSSGGVSTIWQIPDWQQGLDMSLNGGSATMRNVPDVAMIGDNISIFADNGTNQVVGGTSAATPLWAAFTALVNQYAVQKNLPSVGFLNPTLYSIARSAAYTKALHDTTAGDNTSPYSPNKFFAVPGYDLCTGWGSPTGTNLINDLVAPPVPLPVFVIVTNSVNEGNGNDRIDFDECNTLTVGLANEGLLGATNLQATLYCKTPGVFIVQSTSQYEDMPVGGGVATNLVPFKISTTPQFVCGTVVNFALAIKCNQNVTTNYFDLTTGVSGSPIKFANGTPIAIPDGDVFGYSTGMMSTVTVANISQKVSKVKVSVFIAHPYSWELRLDLISPNGTIVTLAEYDGFGANYGLDCDGRSTVFDDDATTPIYFADAPFVGSYQPLLPLAIFSGLSGTNVNGDWKLRVTDQFHDTVVGSLQCWSLSLLPYTCNDGGGECAGLDLSVGMTASPNPVPAGSPLTYSIIVSNAGPSTALSASLIDNLPADCTFVSASPSQGNYAVSGSVLSCNLGDVPPTGTVTISVVVIPNKSATISSTVIISTPSGDYNPANNWATLSTVVSAARADMGITLTASPSPVLAGGLLTYTVNVINYGPSIASNVVVNSYLPQEPALTVNGVSTSQGNALVPTANTSEVDLGIMPVGGTATIKITTIPHAFGQISATSVVTSSQSDPSQGNNHVTTVTTVSQAADLALSLVAKPNPALTNSMITYEVAVTNLGPGNAEGVRLIQYLPSGFPFQSAVCIGVSNLPDFTVTNMIVVTNVFLPAGSNFVLSVNVQAPQTPRTGVSAATVSAILQDPNLANNSVSCTNTVTTAYVEIKPAGTSLITESQLPTNGVVDLNEQVRITFWLKNLGTIAASNVTASLVSDYGVVSPTPTTAVSLGDLSPGNTSPVTFQFTNVSTNAFLETHIRVTTASVTNIFIVTNRFELPKTASFTNKAMITISDHGQASPYPSTNLVSGITNIVEKVTATLIGFTHSYPEDVSVLLVSPTGRKSILMAHAGGWTGSSVSNLSLTFDDWAPTAIPNYRLTSGSYRPFGYPITYTPSLTFSNGPVTTNMVTFAGTDPNGVWTLYVIDDSSGDAGAIAGWSLAITTIPTANNVADLQLNVASSSNQLITGRLMTNTYSIVNVGPNIANNVTFSNNLPSGVMFSDGSSSFVANYSSIGIGDNRMITRIVKVSDSNQINGTNHYVIASSVVASELDLNLANNSLAVAFDSVLPTANLSISLTGPTNLTTVDDVVYNFGVTNVGPNEAIKVVLTNVVPSGLVLSDFGPWATNGTTNLVLRCDLGDLKGGAFTNLTWSARATRAIVITNTVVVSTSSLNSNSASNSVSLVTTLTNPVPQIVAVGTRLVSEMGTKNSTIDAGETVTVEFTLQNTGKRAATNLTAQVQATGATIDATYQTISFGSLPTNASVSCIVKFKATTGAANLVVTFIPSEQGPASLSAIPFTFTLPAPVSLSNPASIIIPEQGPAAPYPATNFVSGVTGVVTSVSVTLKSISHTFPRDINAMLVSPAGQRVVLISHAGAHNSLNNVTLTFTNTASQMLPFSSQIVNGAYLPTQFANITYPGDPSSSILYGLDAFTGSPNGTWSLYVYDDNSGDSGIIANGWDLVINTIVPLVKEAPVAAGLKAKFGSGHLNLTISGCPGMSYTVQTSPDLKKWTTFDTGVAEIDGTRTVTDSNGTNSTRFYRVISLP